MKNIIRNFYLYIRQIIYGIFRHIDTFIYCLLFNKCGKNVIFDLGVKIYTPQNISIGDNVTFNQGVILQATQKGLIEIGNNCVFSYNSMLLTASRIIKNKTITKEHVYGIVVAVVGKADAGLDDQNNKIYKNLRIGWPRWIK